MKEFYPSLLITVCLLAMPIHACADPETVNAGDGVEGAISLESLDSEDASNREDRPLGIEVTSPEGRFSLQAWLRAQTRYSRPFDSDPLTPDAISNPPGGELELRRGRIKAGGQLGSPQLEFYFEHELTGDRPLLDLRVDAQWLDSWHLRLGQYKVLYNRERIDSSGKQTFVERSIATYAFTLDRQRGVTVAKHWAVDTPANQWLMLGMFQGGGRGQGDTAESPLYIARWQWHFLGPDLPFSQSDLEIRLHPAASFALAAATVEGPYTRFSSAGGGQLDGFSSGGDDRYRLRQWLQEFAWHYRGIAVQQELHYKQIDDRELDQHSTLRGGYLQVGKVWPALWGANSVPFELALRYARVDWNGTPADREQREFTIAANLFFEGHNNKLTMDVSRLELDGLSPHNEADTRWRLQWDVSF